MLSQPIDVVRTNIMARGLGLDTMKATHLPYLKPGASQHDGTGHGAPHLQPQLCPRHCAWRRRASALPAPDVRCIPPNCAWVAYSRLSYLHRAWPATELRVPPALPAGRASGECSSRSASPSPSSNRHPYLLPTTYCGCTYYLLLTTNYQSCSPSSSRHRVPSTSSCDLKGW